MNANNVSYNELLELVKTMRVVSILVGLVLDVVVAIACVKLADDKGRNKTAWCFLGLFFGVIALIVLVFLSDKVEVEKESVCNIAIGSVKSTVPSNMWLCECGASNSLSSDYCTVCGKKRKTSPKFDIKSYSGGMEKKVLPEAWECPSCGYKNNPKANMCINCGKERE